MKITSLEPARCLPVPDAGFGALLTERGNLPLESVDVTADISGLIAGVEVTQGFRNPFDVTLEATYVFPLPDRAAVTGFRMEADDRVVEGVLKERGQARADYDKALREGRRAAIAEEDRPDVFTIRVGNILPGEHVSVRLTMSQPLPYEDGAATFRFPLVVAPRYIPGTPIDGPPAGDGVVPDTDAVPDASRISPPVLLPGFPNPVRLSLAATVDAAGLELRELASSLHVVEEEGRTLRLRPGERLDRDFILRMSFDASTSLQLHGPADQGGTFALTVVPPPLESTRTPRDLVLLLDRSGSMAGWKMVAARRAAARIVDTLTPQDRFAVLTFDSVVERAFEGLMEASDRNRYRAVEHLARVDARGGTELLEPLRQAVALLGAQAERERVVVLVTDGQVGNDDQILEQAGGALSAMRVHTVGIDRAVNAGFLGRLAGLGAGRCELVESEDRLDAAMDHIHRRIGAPLVTGLSLKGLEVEPGTVTHLGSIFPGVPLRVYGRYREGSSVTVRGMAAGGPWEEQVEGVRVDNPAIRAVWARAHLRELEDRYAMGEHDLESRIVQTSLEHGVLCRFTAYVAIDTRQVADGGPEHRVIQPVEPPSGWELPQAAPMMGGGLTAHTAMMAMPAAAPRMRPAQPGFGAAELAGGGAPDLTGRQPPMPAPGAPPSGEPDEGIRWRRRGGVPKPGPRPGSGGRLGGPRFAPGPRPAGRLESVRPQLEAELDRLTALPAPDLLYLADLGSRLAALAEYLGGEEELTRLARELEAAEQPGADAQALHGHAIAVLRALIAGTVPPPRPKPRPGPLGDPSGGGQPGGDPSGGGQPGGPQPGGGPRPPFWKRP
ncbi:Ca-activated chloride channel family protein [Nonomuraea polychroma]|uniref:Ca-activated chloride channel family protein n=1 Tax=Nonomuraea polychroma TaxID=46176 RepID=A0A438M0R7_9ACTN|nr:VIT domain-containing protein [Nonomuraea polychroma]RVX39390.1 Ca-activated chloride channel family protein [Nonomuraea polychroma]